MSVKSYLKRCEEFSICSQVGDRAGLVFVEPAVDRMTLYQIAVKGGGRLSTIFNSDFEVGNANGINFASMKHYMGQTTIFESYEPFHIYGFLTIVNILWCFTMFCFCQNNRGACLTTFIFSFKLITNSGDFFSQNSSHN